MSEKTWIEQAVEKVVSEVVDGHVPQLRSELARRMSAELDGRPAAASAESGAAAMLKAVSTIQSGSTQREILRFLLDNTVRYCGRAALFVIKAGAASGWQGRGFPNHEEVKDFQLDVNAGLVARAMQSRMVFSGAASEMDSRFSAQFGVPADGRVMLLPLLLKEKVAALVYADAGAEAGGEMDAAALELLVLATSAWLEVAASRKQTQKESVAAEKPAASAPPAPPAPAMSDPFAAHAPMHAMAAAAPAPAAPSPIVAAAAVPEPIPQPEEHEPAAATQDAFAGMSPDDAEVHRKAQRFARLLVDEIKLYNQAKVNDGRRSKDLYDRLKDDIDKSLATYQKRYGSTVAASADYFHSELVRSLAEDDTSLMGANYQR
jgi:hypothetical protein